MLDQFLSPPEGGVFASLVGGSILTRIATPSTALVHKRNSSDSVSNPHFLRAFEGSLATRQKGISSLFNVVGCCTSRQNSAERSGIHSSLRTFIAHRLHASSRRAFYPSRTSFSIHAETQNDGAILLSLSSSRSYRGKNLFNNFIGSGSVNRLHRRRNRRFR